MSSLDFILGMAGMDDKTVKELDAAMPGLSRLAATAKLLEPLITQAKPHLDALEPLLIQMWPIVQKAWPDIIAVTPTIQDLITYAQSKE